MSKVLVTGGGGFIGSHLVDRLINDGHTVTIVDDFSTGLMANINKQINIIEVDISKNIKLLNSICPDEFDYIFHLAAQINLRESIENPILDAKTNILGTLNVIEAAQKTKAKLIFASTGGAIYSPDADLAWTEGSLADPLSPYGIAKLAAEGYIKTSGLNHCILRLSNVYGPRQNPHGEAGVVAILLNRLINQEDFYIFGDGKQTRDFVYVSDVVDAFIRAMKDDMTGIYNVSSGIETDINSIYETIVDKMWIGGSPKYKPAIPGELQRSCLDNSKLRAMNWTPKVDLDQGLSLTINYFA